MLSYDLDFDADSSRLRVPDVTPEETLLVEDDKHFPSDKPLKSSEAFMRLLELTVGKKSVPEQAGTPSAISPPALHEHPYGLHVHLAGRDLFVGQDTRTRDVSTVESLDVTNVGVQEVQQGAETHSRAERQSVPDPFVAASPVFAAHDQQKTSGERPGATPSSSNDSKTAPTRSAESSSLKEHRDIHRDRIDSPESKARTLKRSSSSSLKEHRDRQRDRTAFTGVKGSNVETLVEPVQAWCGKEFGTWRPIKEAPSPLKILHV
ncbi:hypothetical protein MTO96_022350 [Rhipicephalus appendiculatus]